MSEALYSSAILGLGGQLGPPSRKAYAALERAYGEGNRAYHDLHHLAAVLDEFFRLWDGEDKPMGARVVLALCYHDVVYDSRAKDNEARSAASAREALIPLCIGEPDLSEIERLIVATRDHRPTDEASALVVDADLAILQSSPREYDRYAAAIRKEYAFVPDAEYRTGRTRVLEGLLAHRLFTSPLLDEDAARSNMTREIESLRQNRAR